MRLLMPGVRTQKDNGGSLLRGQKGYMLIEVIVAVAIIGVVAVAFLSALTAGYMALVLADENTMAEALIRTEFENIRQTPFNANAIGYRNDDSADIGYYIMVAVENVVVEPSPNQLWTVEVYHSADYVLTDDELLLTTSSYKVDPNRNLPS